VTGDPGHEFPAVDRGRRAHRGGLAGFRCPRFSASPVFGAPVFGATTGRVATAC